MGVLNLAHGALYAIGALHRRLVDHRTGDKSTGPLIIVGLAGGLALSGIVGWILERSLIRAMYTRALGVPVAADLRGPSAAGGRH